MSYPDRSIHLAARADKGADKHVHDDPHVHVGFGTTLFWWYIALIVGLVLLGGVFSGLTLGLMGLDPVSLPLASSAGSSRSEQEPTNPAVQVNLQVLSLAGTDDERRQAPKVLQLIRSGRHTMLVMLLLCTLDWLSMVHLRYEEPDLTVQAIRSSIPRCPSSWTLSYGTRDTSSFVLSADTSRLAEAGSRCLPAQLSK